MAEKKPMPRLFLMRHGETEWSLNGRHTGRTDIPLTQNGVDVIKRKAFHIAGPGKFLDPTQIGKVYISPRQRARKTFDLLFDGHLHEFTPAADDSSTCDGPGEPGVFHITDDVREWDYGDFEGLKPAEIQARSPGWTIWTDGCPGGESVEEMTARVDKIISKIHECHRRYLEEGLGKRDAMIFSHGHFSRVFISRWMEFTPALGTHFNVEAGGVALLSYNHRNLKEPSLSGLNLYAFSPEHV